jgi:aminoglycoside 3-N-acetyltransferase I
MNGDIEIRRLGPQDRQIARTTFVLMAKVLAERRVVMSDAYIDRLWARSGFWLFAAQDGETPVGGLTAHTLPMTTFEGSEVFIYDIAVAPGHQRRGIGRRLVDALGSSARSAGISMMFVLADDEDSGALDFYRALHGAPR